MKPGSEVTYEARHAGEHDIVCRCRDYQHQGYDAVPSVEEWSRLWLVALQADGLFGGGLRSRITAFRSLPHMLRVLFGGNDER